MSNIPEARERLMALSFKMEPKVANEVREIVWTLLMRERPKRRAAPMSPPLTKQLAKAIKTELDRRPKASLTQIARKFNVNTGRVSEVLHGKRG